jgi:hypothetical protein
MLLMLKSLLNGNRNSYVKKYTHTLQFMKDYPILTIEKCQSKKYLI